MIRFSDDDYRQGRAWQAAYNVWQEAVDRAYPDVRLLSCEACGGEGRELSPRSGRWNDPDLEDYGPCPYCEGGGALVPVEAIECDDLEFLGGEADD